MSKKIEKYQIRIKQLQESRDDLNQTYMQYKKFAEDETQEELVELYAIVLQSGIFLVDLMELIVLFSDEVDVDEIDFSSKCNFRMAVLRMYERVKSLPLLQKRVKILAKQLGVDSNDANYLEYFSKSTKERNALLRTSVIRNTAGHYDHDAVKFIQNIDSVVSGKVFEHAVMATDLVTEFNKYVFLALTQCIDKKSAEYEKALTLQKRKG